MSKTFAEAIEFMCDNDLIDELFYEELDYVKVGKTFKVRFDGRMRNYDEKIHENVLEEEPSEEPFEFDVLLFQKDMNTYDGGVSYYYMQVGDKWYCQEYLYSSWSGSSWEEFFEVDPPKQQTVWVFE